MVFDNDITRRIPHVRHEDCVAPTIELRRHLRLPCIPGQLIQRRFRLVRPTALRREGGPIKGSSPCPHCHVRGGMLKTCETTLKDDLKPASLWMRTMVEEQGETLKQSRTGSSRLSQFRWRCRSQPTLGERRPKHKY